MDNLLAMPVFLGQLLPAGIIGVVSAAMIAAFMSTHDSYLLCWSSVITQDVVAPAKEALGMGRMRTRTRVLLTRVLIVVIGLYIYGWGMFYEGSDDVWDYMAVTGSIYFSGAFALLAGGLYWKRASSTGAAAALATGFLAIGGLGPVRARINTALEWDLTGAHVGLAVIACTCLAMLVGSLVCPDSSLDDEKREADR